MLVRRPRPIDVLPEVEEFRTGPDGQFSHEVPPGDVLLSGMVPPAGYWIPRSQWRGEQIAFGPDLSVHRSDYMVRRGTIWDFQLTKGEKDHMPSGMVWSCGLLSRSGRRPGLG